MASSFSESDRARKLPGQKRLIKEKEKQIERLTLPEVNATSKKQQKLTPFQEFLKIEEMFDLTENCLLNPMDKLVSTFTPPARICLKFCRSNLL
ncbi:unnamed protein product [Amoebophrya sp. A120]|nr:unnamed protein product [Amoebophrya sp. A120]|eukprot:GSA120T00009667001.1